MYESYLNKHNIDDNKIYSINKLKSLNENLLLEMTNIWGNQIGLPYDIWLDPAGKERGNEHTFSPRIKINVDGNLIPMTISDNPDIPESVKKQGVIDFPHISLIKKYIKAYKDVLLAHFLKQISDKDVTQLLKNIKYADTSKEQLKAILNPRIENGQIEYRWDDEELLYIIDVLNSDNEIIITDFATNDFELFSKIEELKEVYEIEKVVKN